MNIVEITQALTEAVSFFIYTTTQVIKLFNPGYVDNVFRDLKVGTLKSLRVYLLIMGLPIFFGYYSHMVYFQAVPYSVENALKVALRYYLIAITAPMVMAYVLYLFDKRLLKTSVSHVEALTMFTYAICPGLLSGFFRIYRETWVLHLILIVYTIYLLYASIGVRYGYERSFLPFVFLILMALISSMFVFIVVSAVLGIPSGYL